MSVPKLRFKEFDGDWEVNSIQHFMNINFILDQMDGNHGELYPKSEEFSSSGVPYVSATDFSSGIIDFSKCKRLPLERAKLFKKGIAQNGDVLFAHNATVGPVAILETELDFVVLSTTATYYRCNGSYLNNNYLKNYFESVFFVQQYFGIMSQSTRNQVPITTQRKLNIAIPSKAEQTKIASFLSAVDEKIQQLNQKQELLNQYKQGMMQKLFSQQIRFKADDGGEFGEWKIEKITKVFTNKSKSFNPLGNEVLPCIELEHLSQNTGKILGVVSSSEQQSTKNIFEPNNVLFGKLRPYLRKFAKPQFKGVCSSEIWVLTGIKLSNDYLFQFIQSEQFTELTNIQSGSKMSRADWKVIADADIEYPCLEEQTKIANFLSAIDKKIAVVAEQIEQTKTWKKGLLQQMFV